MLRSARLRKLAIPLLGVATFLATFLAAAAGKLPTIKVRVDPPAANGPEAYRPRFVPVNGEQIVMIYFGKAHCAWSNRPEMPALVERIKVTLAKRAAERGWSFEAMGVALDWSPEDGMEHLRKFGSFDEVAAGFNWANASALTYFGERIPEPTATPQILVIRRTLLKPNFAEGAFTYRSENARLVTRKVGLLDIHRWVNSSVPLPGL